MNRLIRGHLYKICIWWLSRLTPQWTSYPCSIWVSLRWLTIWWRRHQRRSECLYFLLSLLRVFTLTAKFFLNKREEVVLGNIFELLRSWWASVLEKPLEYFLESILSSLLVCNIIAKSRLFVELSERVSRLLKAYFETVQMNISSVHRRYAALKRLLILGTNLTYILSTLGASAIILIQNSWVTNMLKWLHLRTLCSKPPLTSAYIWKWCSSKHWVSLEPLGVAQIWIGDALIIRESLTLCIIDRFHLRLTLLKWSLLMMKMLVFYYYNSNSLFLI